MTQYSVIDDTIVAVSSAPGGGSRGIVRLSGPQAVTTAAQLLDDRSAQAVQSSRGFRFHHGRIVFDALREAPVVVYVFRAPHSYTRQDIIELHTLGSPPVLEMIVERCMAAGARPAEPGEFTARAYLSGAMSIDAAEAVAETIRARSDDQLRAARRMMRGEIAERVTAWSEELTDLLALVTADIDFSEEPIDFISPAALAERLGALHSKLDALRRAGAGRRRLEVLPYILLLGPPNAGKSTLFNALSGMDRAIASAVSGTTRDVLSAPMRAGRIEAILLDAAGIDESVDEVIAHGRQRALDRASTVHLVCIVIDIAAGSQTDAVRRLTGATDAPNLIVANKGDLLSAASCHKRVTELEGAAMGAVQAVSAKTGQGLDDLRWLMENRLGATHTGVDEVGLTLTARHAAALADAQASIDRAMEHAAGAAGPLDVAELVAFELSEALDALGAITGQVTTEDLLGRIFSSFCIGK